MSPVLEKISQHFGYDFEKMIENVSYMFQLLAVNIDSRSTKRMPLIAIALVQVTAICNIYTFMVSMGWFVLWRCPRSSCDLLTGVANFSFGLASNTACVKLIFILMYQHTIKDIVDGYMTCNAAVVPGSRFSNSVQKTMTDVKKRILYLWIIVLTNCISFVFIAPLMPGKHLIQDKQVLIGLEPMFESPNYEFALLIVGTAVIYIEYVCLCTSTLFMTITGYAEAQMVALSIELTHIWDDARNHYLEESEKSGNKIIVSRREAKSKTLNRYVHNHLTGIIKRHITYLGLLQRVENVFKGALLTEFVLLIVGLISELLGGLKDTYLDVPCTLMLAVIDCWTGQLLINAGEMFEAAVYDCKWENFDKSNMKTVLLMLTNSQRPFKLSAGGISTLNYACLMSIIKSIYSTYTTLRSVMDIK